MPSPFPGMDPFLEDPSVFPDLHGSFNTYLREALQASLPAPYFAVMGERVFVETSQRYIEPDVHVSIPKVPRHASSNGGGAAVLEMTRSQPIVIEMPHDEQRETYVEIHSPTAEGRERLVTVIELLSHANKTPGAKGRDLYLRKQREIIESDIHLVEIDLLRGGEHATAAPLEALKARAGAFDYHVSLRLFDRLECWAYTIRLEDPLPTIAIPLLPGDGSVDVHLQAVFNRCYDAGPYRRRIRYDLDKPAPPLGAKRTRWMKKLIGKNESDAIAGVRRGLAQKAAGQGKPARETMDAIRSATKPQKKEK